MAPAIPFALEKIRAKTPVGSPLDTAGWRDVPIALRERAQFSATIEELRLLQNFQDRLEQSIGGLRRPGLGKDGGPGAFQTRERFIAENQALARDLGLTPRDPRDLGTLKDITSEKRLGLIYDFQKEQAQEYARWRMGQDPDVLAAFPAQEFTRVADRKVPRTDWPRRFMAAGGRIIGGRMVGLKSDPVWRALNRFGVPYPPFDFGSGMGLRDLSRRETESLGLLKPGDKPKPILEDFNASLAASVQDLKPEFQEQLKRIFGDQVEIKDGIANWIVRRPAPQAVSAAARVLGPGEAAPGITGEIDALMSTVSSSAQIQATEEGVVARINGTYGALDGVHGDGPLRPIPITTSVPAAPAGQAQKIFGQYRSVENTQGEALGIDLFAENENLEFSLVHENGHWLDDVGIASPEKWASQSSPLLDTWRQAVARSAAYERIVSDPILSAERREYLLRGRELWARSYAQFIAEESQHPALISSLNQNVRYLGEQWEPNDFEPISAAIRQLFIDLGWMRPPAI